MSFSNVHMIFCVTSFSGFVLSKCLQLSFVVSHLFSWHVRAMEQTCQYLLFQPLLRILVLLVVLFLTSRKQVSAPVQWSGKSKECSYKSRSCHYAHRVCPDSKSASRRLPRQWPRMMQKSQIWNELLAASQPVFPPCKRMQLPPQAVPARQALGIYLDIVMAPQPLGPSGPMARGLLTTTGTQDVDLIPFLVQRTNMREVLFCFSSQVNNITLECLLGSKSSRERPVHLSASLCPLCG